MLKLSEIQIDQLSPMMKQYASLREAHPDCLLFFRLGDFYELFFEDAVLVAKELDLTLTGRECGLSERAPMAGVPYHSVDSYLFRLLRKGYKIAICEQTEDPAQAQGLVQRDVVRILTPGTVTADELLEAKRESWLMAIVKRDRYYGIAALDMASGRTQTRNLFSEDASVVLQDEILRLQPREILMDEDWQLDRAQERVLERLKIRLTQRPSGDFQTLLDDSRLAPASPGELWPAAAAALIRYLEQTQFQWPRHMQRFEPEADIARLKMDGNCRLNLELTETIWERKYRGSLLHCMDYCVTAMGSRMLRRELEEPPADLELIRSRQTAVAEWVAAFIPRQNLREILRGFIDLERLSAKIAMQRLSPRDLIAIAETHARIVSVQTIMTELKAEINVHLAQNLTAYSALADFIQSAIVPEPPPHSREGGLIREGFSPRLDELRELAHGGRSRLLELEEEARENSGIKKLKVGYNRVFGYYFEVPKSQSQEMPDSFTRRQTLRNSERFVNQELKALEEEIIGAEAEALELEQELFIEVCRAIEEELLLFRQNAESLMTIDFLSALAELAERHHYVQPELSLDPILDIQGGRHPVVEQSLEEQSFVPNDLVIDDKERILVLTGPNMAGKSTYLRQTALLTIMAHLGSFVPAKRAVIGLCDQIFTRIGAADNLSKGQSTFMIEMLELATILQKMSSNSLLILDEIGRGTSTFDGLAIAWAVLEHLANQGQLAARTLFATHYHELCDLESEVPALFNAHLTVDTQGQELRFLHQVELGPSSDSYGIEVARLAGVPDSLIARADVILADLERSHNGKRIKRAKHQELPGQMGFGLETRHSRVEQEVLKLIRTVDINTLRPIEGLQWLCELQGRLKEE